MDREMPQKGGREQRYKMTNRRIPLGSKLVMSNESPTIVRNKFLRKAQNRPAIPRSAGIEKDRTHWQVRRIRRMHVDVAMEAFELVA